MKRITAILFAAVMAFSVISGCTSSSPTPAPATATPAPATPVPAAAATPAPEPETPAFIGYDGVSNLRITEDPMTVTLFSAFGGNLAPEGDMAVWAAAADITGITMQNVANPSIADPTESMNTMLATGDLPDIIFGQKFLLQALVQQGAFIPMKDLIDEYAPNIKAYLNNITEARYVSTSGDGEIYFIAGTISSSKAAATELITTQCYFTRKDWLDKLEMDFPKTFDDFEAMLYAFRNDDPNGNGVKDEIPFFYRDGSPLGLYQLFGVKGNWAVFTLDWDKNEMIHARVTEEYKNALRTMSRWYADGLIDPEILTRGSNARQELLGNNIGGCTFDWHESTSNMNYNEELLAAVPDLQFLPFVTPANVYGKVVTEYSDSPVTESDCWGISKDCKDPVAIVKYLDFWFSDAGCMLSQWGIEGMSYNIVNGEPQFSEEAYAYGAGIPNYMRTLGVTGAVMGRFYIDISAKTDIAREAFMMYQKDANLVPPSPVFPFNEEEDLIIGRYAGGIDTLWTEYEQQVLYGEKDVDASWAGYLAEMEALGLYQMLDAYNSAYQRYFESIN